MSLATLLETIEGLPPVSSKHSTIYRDHRSRLLLDQDQALSQRPDIMTLLGNNPLAIMQHNHRHHVDFMVSVFKLGDYRLLARTLPWVYRSYHSHGFRFEYFQVELEQWRRSIQESLPSSTAAAILPVYDWMLDQHELVVSLARTQNEVQVPPDSETELLKNAFLAASLQGDSHTCVGLAEKALQAGMDIEVFYLQVLQPALHEVGRLWENAEISVAQEHLAAAIVNRVLAFLNNEMPLVDSWRGRILVSAAPNEFHEIGARMLTDILEQDGWDVLFTGANVPVDQLMLLIDEARPDILALSVTLPFNLAEAQDIIDSCLERPSCQDLKILVGGGAFRDTGDLWRKMGAHGYAENAAVAKELVRTWQDCRE